MNTIPTVVRLTAKLKRPEVTGKEPFCPLCLGIRDEVNNLLEVGSTIKRIVPCAQDDGGSTAFLTASKDDVVPYESSDEWFPEKLSRAFCFGCKRMVFEAKD